MLARTSDLPATCKRGMALVSSLVGPDRRVTLGNCCHKTTSVRAPTSERGADRQCRVPCMVMTVGIGKSPSAATGVLRGFGVSEFRGFGGSGVRRSQEVGSPVPH